MLFAQKLRSLCARLRRWLWRARHADLTRCQGAAGSRFCVEAPKIAHFFIQLHKNLTD